MTWGMRRRAFAGVLAVLVMGQQPVLAAPPAATPPPSPPPMTTNVPPAANDADDGSHGKASTPVRAKTCMRAAQRPLLGRAKYVRHLGLLPTTHLIGAGSRTQIVLLGSSAVQGLSELRLYTFFVDDAASEQPGKLPESEALLVADSLTADNNKDLADKLQITQSGNAVLQIDVPEDASRGWWWADNQRIVIVACRGEEIAPVFAAEATFKLSPVWLPRILGISGTVGLYLFLCLMLWRSRNRLSPEARATRRAARKMKASGSTTAALAPAPAPAPSATGLPVFRTTDIVEWNWWRYLDPVALTSDIFDKGSLSNLQILFFALLVSYGLAFIVLRTGELSTISPTVVGLLGISAFGSLGDKVVGTTRNRLSTENWSWLVSRKVLPINDPGTDEPHWSDLVMSDSELDLYKVQALTFTLIVGFGMIIGGFSLATFSVPQELLEVLGLSQFVFVGGRLAKPATMGDLDDMLDTLRKRESELRTAAFNGVDTDSDGKPVTTPPDPTRIPKPPYTTMRDAGAQGAVPNAVQRYLDVAKEVKVLLQAMSHRAVDVTSLENPSLV